LREAILPFLIRVVGAGATFGLQILLARLMSPEAYGGYVIAWSWILALGSVVSLGLGEVAVRVLPRYQARGRHGRAAMFFRRGMQFIGIAGLSTAILGIALLHLLPVAEPMLALLIVIAAGLPFIAFEYFLEGAARSLGWFRFISISVYIVRPMMIAGACLALHLFDVPLTLAVAGSVTILCVAATALAAYLLIAAHLPVPRTERHASARLSRHWLMAAFPMLFVSVLEDMLPAFDVMLVGALLGAGDAGVYFAAGRILALAHFAQYAVIFVSGRALSLALANADRNAARARLQEATLATFLATLAAVAITLIAGHSLLGWFGEDFASGFVPMCILAAGLVARSLAVSAHEYLLLAGRHWPLIAINGFALIVLAGLSLLLIPLFGLIGAAIASALTMALRSALLLWQVKQRAVRCEVGRKPLGQSA
jgi:O-antigen/teichoic acid export membrane protein